MKLRRGCHTIYTLRDTIIPEKTKKTRGGGGDVLALVIWPLTTHPFRDSTPFLLLLIIEAPLTFRLSLRCFHMVNSFSLLILLCPSCFAAFGHHLHNDRFLASSIYYDVIVDQNSSMSHSSISLIISPLTYPFPPCTFHILVLYYVSSTLYCSATRAQHLRFYFLLLLAMLVYVPLPSFWQVQDTHTISRFQNFREVLRAVRICFHSYSSA